MAHAAPPPPGRKLRVRLLGVGVVVLGIALLAVTIASLDRPGQRQAGRTTQSASTDVSGGVSSPTPSTPASAPSTPTKPTTPPATPTAPKRSSAAPTVAKVALVIANNTGQAGLASLAATRFEAAGWQVSDLSNFTGDIISTCAYYDPSNPASQAAALALQKQFPAIKRVKPRFDGLPEAPIVVVLTTDYS
jgi:cytoskeletal protein RodZ